MFIQDKLKIKNLKFKILRLYFFNFLTLNFALFLCFSGIAAGYQSIENVLKEYLKEHYPWAEYEISDLTISDTPTDKIPEKIIVEKGLPGKTIFILEFKDGKKIRATARVKAFDWVLMSKRPLRKGYQLQADDLYTALMDLTKIPKGALQDADKAEGKTLTRSIIANKPLTDNMISDAPVVKKGQAVIILLESPNINIAAKGELKGNSRVGDHVKVINTATKKVLTGILTDENTVKVEF